jgi:lipopolysaccharide biosynthesis glycosyltransferase
MRTAQRGASAVGYSDFKPIEIKEWRMKAAISPGCAVCYVTDTNFMFPTLASAVGLRQYIPPTVAQVFVLAFGLPASIKAKAGEFCVAHSINLIAVTDDLIAVFDSADYNKTHVPPTTLGRLFLDQLLPSDVDYILYLDGDTIVNADPAVLVNYRAPTGQVAAAEDLSYFRQYDRSAIGEGIRAYYRGLDINGDKGYFNAGVLSADRRTWKTLCAEALTYFRENTKLCLYHDQSALNAISRGRRIRLYPGWNFITHYRVWGLEQRLPPRIFHFAGGEKPWMGEIDPWREFAAKYQSFAAEVKNLELPIHRLTQADEVRINRHVALRNYALQIAFRRRLNRYRAMVEEVIRTAGAGVLSVP